MSGDEFRTGWTDDSAIRTLSREACALGGAARAILLQVAHPAVGRGVAEHSRFDEDPMARLRGTLHFVFGVVFGTPEEVEWVSRRVRRIHRGVVGAGYSADDPELQVWVAATLHQSAVQMYEIAFGPMPVELREELCRQGAFLATTLGCPAELWPGSAAEFDEYWDRQVAELAVGDEARRICRDLMYNRALPWYVRMGLPTVRLVTAGLLPPALREAYGFRWNPRRERLFRVGARGVRLVYRRVPRTLRGLPTAYYLRGLRRQYARYGGPAGTGGRAVSAS